MSPPISAAHGFMKWKAFVWRRAINLCTHYTAEKVRITCKAVCEIGVHNPVLVAIVWFEQDSTVRSTSNGP